jgi:hypothetical protein
MRNAIIAGLTVAALASAAAAADEKWLVVGGDGSALGYDAASMKKDAAGIAAIRYSVFSATALAPPPGMVDSTLFGFVGEMAINCKDRTFKSGGTTYYFAASGAERAVVAPPNATFEKAKAGDYRNYFAEVACNGRKDIDAYPAAGRANAVALMKKIAATPHVTINAGKGWTFAQGDGARLVAVDTSSAKRQGAIVTQTEINWMLKPQATNGQPWRYYQLTTEYDCAGNKRRGAGFLRIYDGQDRPVHEETVSEAAWEAVTGPGPTALLEMACKNRKLTGLPSGSRTAVLSRLKEIAAVQ